MIVRVAMTLPLRRQVDADGAEQRPQAARPPPTPSRRPTNDPSRPIVRPSPTTERMTWPREAPSVRSSANSRIRCVTVIEKVLKMMNAPTNSEMPGEREQQRRQEAQVVLDVARTACAPPPGRSGR